MKVEFIISGLVQIYNNEMSLSSRNGLNNNVTESHLIEAGIEIITDQLKSRFVDTISHNVSHH